MAEFDWHREPSWVQGIYEEAMLSLGREPGGDYRTTNLREARFVREHFSTMANALLYAFPWPSFAWKMTVSSPKAIARSDYWSWAFDLPMPQQPIGAVYLEGDSESHVDWVVMQDELWSTSDRNHVILLPSIRPTFAHLRAWFREQLILELAFAMARFGGMAGSKDASGLADIMAGLARDHMGQAQAVLSQSTKPEALRHA